MIIGDYIETARFPSDTDGLVPHLRCRHCGGSVIGDFREGFTCLSCSRQICPLCLGIVLAGLCTRCWGGTLPLRWNAGH